MLFLQSKSFCEPPTMNTPSFPKKHRPRKRFGQNFLQNPQIIDAILTAIDPQPTDAMIEIGPGLGALTRPLLNRLPHLRAIEIDRDLQVELAAMPEAASKLELINADALTIDYKSLGSHLRLIGNLPYNISTPLLIRLLQSTAYIQDMHFMLQKEVVERMAAAPGNKTYGRLSVMVQYYCEVEILLDVPPDAFFPQPKVDSAIVRLTPFAQSPYMPIAFADLERCMAQAFSMRRKTLANNFKPFMTADEIMSLSIDPKARPEQISIEQYVKIAKFISK